MTDHKIALVYFSATHVTRSFVRVMEAALVERGCKAMLFNVTPYDSRQEPLPLDDYDGIIFGFPVFADFAPSVINAWLPTLDGQGKRCATFFTYGGRATGYAHVHTRQLLEGAGFQVLFSAEFLGRHSFNVSGWRVLPDRPDKGDFSLAREYVDLSWTVCTSWTHLPSNCRRPPDTAARSLPLGINQKNQPAGGRIPSGSQTPAACAEIARPVARPRHSMPTLAYPTLGYALSACTASTSAQIKSLKQTRTSAYPMRILCRSVN